MRRRPYEPLRRCALVIVLAVPEGGFAGAVCGQDTVQAFGNKNPQCLAWSDGCVICARDEHAEAHCSTPGIACISAAITCKMSRKPP